MNRMQKWLIAIRPWAYPASITPVLLGVAIAGCAGHPFRGMRFALTLLGVVCFHTAANLINDIHDFRRGLDQEVYPTSGAVVRGLLSEQQIWRAAGLCLAIGGAIGLWLAYVVGWPILVLGLAGAGIAWGYTGQRFAFKYHGLGDLVIWLAFGILPVLGAYWVQAGSFDWKPAIWFLPPSLLTVGILHANNWRDLSSDAVHDCRTVASALGPAGSRRYYRALILLPYLLVAAYFAAGIFIPAVKVQPLVLLALLTLPAALRLARVSESSECFSRLDGETAKLQLLFGLVLSAGFFGSQFIHWV